MLVVTSGRASNDGIKTSEDSFIVIVASVAFSPWPSMESAGYSAEILGCSEWIKDRKFDKVSPSYCRPTLALFTLLCFLSDREERLISHWRPLICVGLCPATRLHAGSECGNSFRIRKAPESTCVRAWWHVLRQVNGILPNNSSSNVSKYLLLYGYSCCVDETASQHVAADCIVHFGRSCLTPNSHLPVYYILPKHSLDITKCAHLIARTFDTTEEPILVLYDVVYHHLRGNEIYSIVWNHIIKFWNN